MDSTSPIELEIDRSLTDRGITDKGNSWNISLCDALEGLNRIKTDSVNCVITSPPYFWLRDYGVEGQLGLESTIDGYVDALSVIMSECLRVVKEDGVVFLNLGNTYYSGRGESKGIDAKSSKRRFGLRAVDQGGGMGKGIKSKSIIGMPWRVAIKLIESGWILRSPIIWNRVSCLPEAVKDRPLRQFEYLFMFVKSRKYKFNRKVLEESGEEDIWNIDVNTGNSSNKRSAPFPIELAERCILISTHEDDIILDPFMGNGTTLIAALNNKRNAIGIDINNEFYNHVKISLEKL